MRKSSKSEWIVLSKYLAWSLSMSLVFLCLSCQQPATHDGVYNIEEYGAVGDSVTMNTHAIQTAIDACAEAGGGQVLVPPGSFLTGSVSLKSNVELHLAMGATLYGSADSVDYPLVLEDTLSFARDGVSRQAYFALIMADRVENIAITGHGTINGNGGAGEDFRCYPLTEDGSRWRKPDRPRLIYFYQVKNIKLHGFKAINPNYWTIHLKRCDFVDIDGIEVYAHANANADGIDLDETQNVSISNCVIDTDDDALVFKSLGTRPCKNITVSNCLISSKITPIKTGTESGGGFQNITITNCVIRPSYETETYDPLRSTKHSAGIALEVVDGGVMDGIVISNIVIDGSYAPFFLRLGNRGRQYGGEVPEPGVMRNIVIENVICRNVYNDYASTIAGFPGHYIENLTLSNIRMECEGGIQTDLLNPMPEHEKHYPWPGMYGKELPYPAYGIFFRHVKNLTMNNIQITYGQQDSRPALYLDNVVDARIVDADLMSAGQAVFQVNTSNVRMIK